MSTALTLMELDDYAVYCRGFADSTTGFQRDLWSSRADWIDRVATELRAATDRVKQLETELANSYSKGFHDGKVAADAGTEYQGPRL